ncbi:MAG: DUF86 domain-containing protein [Desulfuromusa sp.]|nr:DUF86 domain-containing protein [Desulfuromusa sp.]
MQREIRKYLFDIKESIDSINDYLGEKRDFQSYLEKKILRRAVERELEIIGEATNRLLKLDQNIAISDSRRIVNLRNLVIHGYDQVDNVIIWGLISKDIPLLKKQVDNLLGDI